VAAIAHRAAFLPNEHTDLTQASDGISRFGAYVAQHRDVFYPFGQENPPTDDPVEYALAAWHVANPPIMAPGYVSWHPQIQATSPHWDDDHRAALAVDIAMAAPSAVTAALTVAWREWDYQTRPQSWAQPWDNDRLAMLATLTIRIPLTAHRLPEPCYRQGIPCPDTAKRAVIMMCIAINTELDSVLSALDTPTRHITTNGGPP
jgi:hypothetical protein